MAEEDTETTAHGKPAILKGWATVIASVAALVTAISALLKTPAEPAAEASYKTLAAAVKENSEQSAKNHDDLLNLRNYMEGYIRADRPAASAEPPAPVASTSAPAATGLRLGSGSLGHGAGAAKPAPPPTLGPRPPVWEPPDFSQVKKR